MKEIIGEIGGCMLTGAVAMLIIAMVYNVYFGDFKSMIETFFLNICG